MDNSATMSVGQPPASEHWLHPFAVEIPHPVILGKFSPLEAIRTRKPGVFIWVIRS